jgi:2-hydroxy-6-oxonona-2,4-dienedioate hydrolase
MDSQSMPLTSLWTKVPGGEMHIRTNLYPPPADVPVVVLVHGMVISSSYMVPTAERLALLCRVYAPDLPGYGQSYKPWPILLLPQLADALAIWMDTVGIPKAHLVGNSFGCQIIAEFALRYPDRVDRIVLQGPTVDPQARTLSQQLFRLGLNSLNEPLSLGRVTRQDYRAAGMRRAWRTLKLVIADRIEEKLPRIQAPTLVVRGAKGPVVPQRWAEEVARLLPKGQLIVIPGCPHTLNYSAPLEFVRVMRPFLQL